MLSTLFFEQFYVNLFRVTVPEPRVVGGRGGNRECFMSEWETPPRDRECRLYFFPLTTTRGGEILPSQEAAPAIRSCFALYLSTRGEMSYPSLCSEPFVRTMVGNSLKQGSSFIVWEEGPNLRETRMPNAERDSMLILIKTRSNWHNPPDQWMEWRQ